MTIMATEESITWLYSIQQIAVKNYETALIILLVLLSFLVAHKIPKTAHVFKEVVMRAIQCIAQRCLHRKLTAPEKEIVEDVVENALGVEDEDVKNALFSTENA